MNNLRRVAGNLFSLFSGEVVSSALAFVITIVLARRLSDEGFGRLAFVQATMVYFILAVDLGLSTFGIREIARKPEHLPIISGQIISLRLLMAGIVAIPLAIGVIFWPMPQEMRWLFWGSLLGLFAHALNPEFIFQGAERMAGVSVWRILVHLFYLLLIFLLVFDRGQLWIITLLRASAEAFTLLLILVWAISSSGFRLNLSWNPTLWRSYLRESLIMAASVVAIKLYYTFDTLMLGIMDRPETVGWYQAGYKIILLFIGLAGIVQMAFGPVFSRSSKPESLESSVKMFATVLYLAAILSTSFLVFLKTEIIQILFGSMYTGSVQCLALLAISMFFVFISTIFMAPLLFIGRQKDYLAIVMSGAILNIILNLLLIPKYSYNGAAVATIVSNFGMMLLSMRRYYSITVQIHTISYVSKWIIVFLLINLLIYWLLGSGVGPLAAALLLTFSIYSVFNYEYIRKIFGELRRIASYFSEKRTCQK